MKPTLFSPSRNSLSMRYDSVCSCVRRKINFITFLNLIIGFNFAAVTYSLYHAFILACTLSGCFENSAQIVCILKLCNLDWARSVLDVLMIAVRVDEPSTESF